MINTKLKSLLLLTITLIIGIVIGFLAKSWISDHRFDRFGRLMGEGGFISFIEENIDISATQREELIPILNVFREKISTHAEESRREFHMLMDSLKSNLKNILTEEQYNKLMENRLFHPPKRYKGSKSSKNQMQDTLKVEQQEVEYR